ncbi:MAG: mechanosensitive ion channel [Burkholderiaceae bacterium]|nr:mechanosensitive ion channel [Burkholderiaceae bacterium]
MLGSSADLDAWLAALTRPSVPIELAVLAACVGLAWLAVRLARRGLDPQHRASSVWFGMRIVDGVLFPVMALLFTLAARWRLESVQPVALLHLAVPILASLVVIRIAVRVLRVAFPNSQAVRVLERTLSWLVWGALVLWLTGLLPLVLTELDAVHWKLGGVDVSLRSLVEGALSAVVVLVVMLWVSAAIESRLLAGVSDNLSVRKIAANAVRALLLLVGLLLALSAAGIPLGALSVMGGALGVGLGFGLQKLAANYVSGFVILAERSLRIGDMVTVDNFEGRVTDINTRYTVVRALNGRESIVPNEMLITQRVENWSLADPKVQISTTLQVAYGTDLDALLPRLAAAVREVPRVLADPPPQARLAAFGADGLDLSVGFWIGDPQNGQGNVRSDVNLALLRTLNALGVSIPFPQRVVHQAPPAP